MLGTKLLGGNKGDFYEFESTLMDKVGFYILGGNEFDSRDILGLDPPFESVLFLS